MEDGAQLKDFLDRKVEEYNRPSFIAADPVSIPHLFSNKQDIEIAGFFAATFAWGNRTTIINKCSELMSLMGGSPHDFILHHRPSQLRKLEGFCHRTFNTTDLLYFISFLRHHYKRYDSLEDAFVGGIDAAHPGASRRPSREGIQALGRDASPYSSGNSHIANNFESQSAKAIPSREGPLSEAKRGWVEPIELYLNYFYTYFFSLKHVPERTRKHVASPMKNSSCKRLNMFLRWMVRNDTHGVDFGIWKRISPSQLIIPLDLHVARVAKRFNLLSRPNADWKSALELTGHLRRFDPEDPVKYDFALFALGVVERF